MPVSPIVLLTVLAACSSGRAAGTEWPAADYGGVPDLSGTTVLVMPAQGVEEGIGDPDPEIAFAVSERSGRTRWVLPGDLRRALSRSPGVPADPDRLAVEMFLQAEVRRVGDPLFGELRRMSALVDAQAVLIPIRVRHGRSADGSGTVGAIEITAALIDVRSGRVHWSGRVGGVSGSPTEPAALATAAAALVRRISP